MLVTNHVLAGALIGRAARTVPGAFVAGVASHFVLDTVPHWGGRPIEEVMGVAVTDGLTGLAAMATVFRATEPGRRARVLAGMAGGAFPDLDKPSTVFFGFSPFPDAVDAFHGRIQRESVRRMPQEILVGLGSAMLVAALTRRSRRKASR